MSKILVIDDDHYIVEVISRLLGLYDYDVAKAYLGRDGISIAKETLPDVILLDRVMPDLDGVEVCKELKNDESTKDIPIIFVTSRTEVEHLVEALEIGAQDYISKPIEKKELIARVRAALRVKQLQDQLKDKLRISKQMEETHQQLMEQYMLAMFGQLAESLMHELNNPLMAVIGLAELIKVRNITKDKQLLEHIEMIRDMGMRASTKLSSLLCIAKSEGSEVGVNVNKIVKDVVELVNAQLLITGVELELSLEENLKKIRGDQSQIARALLALVNNAIEATKQARVGNKKISVATSQLSEDKISIRVRNSGEAIDKEIAEKIFEPFFTTKKGSYHAGMGLYVVQSIAKLHNGSVNWESDKGNTWFEIVLPV